MTFGLLQGVRVLDLSTGIAGAYATKLLADAGADVVKAEPTGGDPLRRWSASGAELGDDDGAFFQFLARGKRSVVGDVDELLARADIVVESGRLDLDTIDAHARGQVMTSVTPFGRRGPWADRPATDFTLQAWGGSLAFRGLPEREPLQIAGRLSELFAGAYAAVGALAALRTGRGEHVDVAVLECLIERFGGVSPLSVTLTGYSHQMPIRTLEFPAVEPTADGYVGLCPMTAQHFSDLMVAAGRADLADDRDLASFPGRWRRRVELREIMRAWCLPQTTAEIVEQATTFRIPAAPVASPETVATSEHVTAREVFTDGVPRVPYQLDGEAARPAPDAPALGAHTGAIDWPARHEHRVESGELPLAGVRVVDFTSFWAGPLATHLLATLGAEVVHVESIQRPDGYRFIRLSTTDLPDDWYERSAGYQSINTNKLGVTLDVASPEGRELLLQLAEHADVFVENWAPRVFDNLGLSSELLRERNPSLVITRMPAYGLTGPWRDRSAFASTIEVTSGLSWRSGYRDGPPITLRGPADPIAGVHAAFAILAALHDGRPHVIESSMIESALNLGAELAIEHAAYGASLPRQGNRSPEAAPQGLYACQGVEQWLALAVATDEQWQAFRKALGDPTWAAEVAFDTLSGRQRAHDDIDRHLSAWAADRDLDEVVAVLLEHGIPAAPVVDPLLLRRHEHLVARRYYEPLSSELLGEHTISRVPILFASRTEPLTRHAAPTLGQHNHRVLGGWLGLDHDMLAGLEARQVIGTRPLGL